MQIQGGAQKKKRRFIFGASSEKCEGCWGNGRFQDVIIANILEIEFSKNKRG
jgi:hypothetical protein